MGSAVTALVGCGGSDKSQLTRENVELAMTESLRAGLPEDTSLSRLRCIDDGEYHWRCVTLKTDASDVRLQIVVAITCDGETGRCLAEQQSASSLP